MSANTATVEVQCPVMLTDSGDAQGIEFHRCEGGLEIEFVWEPGESNWGADADGNRGMYVAGYWQVGDIPEKCDSCGFVFTDAGKLQIEREACEKADSLEEPDGLYPDERDENDGRDDMDWRDE